jgi:hypothetical protein
MLQDMNMYMITVTIINWYRQEEYSSHNNTNNTDVALYTVHDITITIAIRFCPFSDEGV